MSSRNSAPVVEVVFSFTDDRYPFIRMSDREDCQFEMLRLLPRGERRYAEFFNVTGADPIAVQKRAENFDQIESRLLAMENSGGLFEFEVTGACPVADIARKHAIPRTARSEDGRGRVEAEVVPPPDPAELVADYQSAHPDATLVEMTETDRSVPLFTQRELAATLEDRLTDRQLEVLRTAYERGYYERPREVTGAELAAEFDISVATLSQHIRVAERRLLSLLFENNLFSNPAL